MAKKQIGEVDYNVEFNDSVLSTQTWNNSRYNGSKTETQVLNKYTAGDTTYGTKTAIQKYTRNIYVGDYIAACSGSDDPNLVPFPGFSYLMTTKYITVNEDDTVDEKRFRAGVPDEKVGFYRSFLEDFTPGTQCQVYLLNEGVNNSLDDGYNVYFADGRLKKNVFSLTVDPEVVTSEEDDFYFPSFNAAFPNNLGLFTTTVNPDSLREAYEVEIFNNSETSFYTSSNILLPQSKSEFSFFINDFVTNIQESTENRFFITFTTGSNGLENLKNISNNRSHLFTYEVQSWGNNVVRYVLDTSNKFVEADFIIGGVSGLRGVSFFISKLNDNIPSILVNLPKDEHLPNGLVPGNYIGGNFVADPSALQGPKFVVIPENIHPFIKDNIKYFLIKAGLMAENQNLTINTQNRQLL
jgi:hypothetical protein